MTKEQVKEILDRVLAWPPERQADIAHAVELMEAQDRSDVQLTDEQLAPGIRSVAAPLRDGDGRVIAAMNVTVHAAETPVEILTGEYLPWLLQTAGAVSADWAACQSAPQLAAGRAAEQRTTVRPADNRTGERMRSHT